MTERAKLEAKIAAAELTLAAVAEESKLFCKDQKVPLDERWEFFITKAPKKNVDGWIHHFRCMQAVKADDYDTVDRAMHSICEWNRQQEVSVEALVEQFENLQATLQGTSPPWQSYFKHYDLAKAAMRCEAIKSFDINLLKEEILHDYLGSWIHDW